MWKLSELRKKNDHVVLDVRTRKEFSEGRLAGAISMDFFHPSFEEEVNKLDRSQAYVVYCRSGIRSRRVCEIMAEKGFDRLYNLEMGIVI